MFGNSMMMGATATPAIPPEVLLYIRAGTIVDSSLYNRTVAINSDAQLSNDVPLFGLSNIKFSGTNDAIQALNLGSFAQNEPYTVSWWQYVPAYVSAVGYIDFRNGSGNTGGNILVYTGSPANTQRIVVFFPPSSNLLITDNNQSNSWAFYSVTRTASALFLHVNGVLVASNSAALEWRREFNLDRFTAGSWFNFTNSMTGYLSDILVRRGALYSSANYTVPSGPAY